MPVIRVETGPEPGREFELEEELTVGRDQDADICVPLPEISRRHCRVCREGIHCVVEDLGSRNGTVVNGVYQQRAELRDGDEIRLGKVTLRFCDVGGAAAPAAGSNVYEPVTCMAGNAEVSVVLDAARMQSAIEGLGHEQALQRLQTFFQVAQTLSVHTDEKEIVPEILQCLLQIFPQSSRAYILTGACVEELEERGRLSRDPDTTDSGARISRTILAAVLGKKEAVLSSDAASDERFADGLSIIQHNIHTMMCAPLVAHDEILGIIEVDSSSVVDPFSEDDLNLLVGVASQVALFLRNLLLANRAATERAHRRQLERFFSPAVARTVIENELELGGELREGVVLFCDIVGFTPMSENTDAPELVRLLNIYLGMMVEKIQEYDGTIDKFGGDAILCVWGAPTTVEDDASRAVRAALAMQNEMVAYNRQLAAMGVNPIGMGIGLHAGRFIAGNIGSRERMEYTVIGRDVNLAQRIESKAASGMIMVSESLAQRANGRVLGCRFPAVSLKGASVAHSLVCLRGLATDAGTVLALPVLINGQTPANIVSVDDDGRTLRLLSTCELETSRELVLEFRTPERESPPLSVAVEAPVAGQSRCWVCRCEPSEGYLHELVRAGVLEGASNGIPWERHE